MSPIVERLVVLRQPLEHLQLIRSRIRGAEMLSADLSLRNDVLYALSRPVRS